MPLEPIAATNTTSAKYQYPPTAGCTSLARLHANKRDPTAVPLHNSAKKLADSLVNSALLTDVADHAHVQNRLLVMHIHALSKSIAHFGLRP